MIINKIRKWLPFQIVIRFLIWFVVVLIIGLADVYQFRFDPRRFFTAEYLTEVGIILSLGVFIFIFRLIEKAKDLREQGERYEVERELEDTLSKYNVTYKLSEVSKFIVYLNIERRVEAYRREMELRLQTTIAKLNQIELRIYANNEKYDKKEYPKLRKIEEYKDKLEEDFIQNNKTYLKANFTPISPDFMTNGINANLKQKEQDTPSSKTLTAVKDNAMSMTIPTLLVAFVLGSILTRQEVDMWATVLNISIKLFLLLMQHWSAGEYAPTWLAKTWIHDLHLRKSLWERFFVSKIKTNTVTKSETKTATAKKPATKKAKVVTT